MFGSHKDFEFVYPIPAYPRKFLHLATDIGRLVGGWPVLDFRADFRAYRFPVSASGLVS